VIIFEIFPSVIRSLIRNPIRSTLTTLGVVIGVFIVITTVSLGAGAKNFIYDQMSSFGVGSNSLAIYGAAESEKGMGIMSSVMMKSSITWQDIQAIREHVPNLLAVIPAVMGTGDFKYGNKTYETFFVIGTTEDYQKLIKDIVAQGRFLNSLDVAYHKRVVFIGQAISDGLFGAFPPVGELVKLNGNNFRVIGVMKDMGSIMGMNMNEMACIPITTAQDVFKTKEIIETWVMVDDVSGVPRAKKEIEAVLLQRHGEKDFQVRIATDMLAQIDDVMNALTMVISAIAAISLLVGSVGIMNIMLVTVAERVREIGIRKSVGAKQRDIFMQFLLESTVISLLGGIVGIILGSIVLFLIGKIINVALAPSLLAVVIAFVVSCVVGVVSGVYPAVRAARLDPIEALRG